MSMVRFLVYSNHFDVEGLIATTSTWMKNKVRPDVLQMLVGAYEEVRPRLLRHQPGFPPADALRAAIVAGQPGYGMAAVGPDKMSPGAELIIRAAERNDPRPLWVLAWGGTNTLAQALTHARTTRTAAQLEALVAKLRVYSISDQDDAGPWIRREFPALHYIGLPSTPDGDQYYLATWTGISGDRFYKNAPGADFTTFTDEWVNSQHPQQGAARQALPDAVLHSRGRYAGVSRPHRQRPGELHEPVVWRLGRPLRLAHVLRRDAGRPGRRAAIRFLDATTRRTRWSVSTAAPTRPTRRRSGGGAPRSSTTSPRAWTGPSRSRRRRTTTPRSW